MSNQTDYEQERKTLSGVIDALGKELAAEREALERAEARVITNNLQAMAEKKELYAKLAAVTAERDALREKLDEALSNVINTAPENKIDDAIQYASEVRAQLAALQSIAVDEDEWRREFEAGMGRSNLERYETGGYVFDMVEFYWSGYKMDRRRTAPVIAALQAQVAALQPLADMAAGLLAEKEGGK